MSCADSGSSSGCGATAGPSTTSLGVGTGGRPVRRCCYSWQTASWSRSVTRRGALVVCVRSSEELTWAPADAAGDDAIGGTVPAVVLRAQPR